LKISFGDFGAARD